MGRDCLRRARGRSRGRRMWRERLVGAWEESSLARSILPSSQPMGTLGKIQILWLQSWELRTTLWTRKKLRRMFWRIMSNIRLNITSAMTISREISFSEEKWQTRVSFQSVLWRALTEFSNWLKTSIWLWRVSSHQTLLRWKTAWWSDLAIILSAGP